MFKSSLKRKFTGLQQFHFKVLEYKRVFVFHPLHSCLSRALAFLCSLCLTCPSELLRHLIAQKDELVEEVDTLREMLRVS